jgi:hypothetical protein
MSLKIPSPPTSTLRAYKSGLSDFVDSGCSLWNLMLQRHQAHAVHNLHLQKLHDALCQNPCPPLDEKVTKPTGWRFLASDTGLVGACHVGAESTGAAPKVTGFSNASEIEGITGLIGRLGNLPEVQKDTFELRVLRITWLHHEAFWLHSVTGGVDLVIPYTTFAVGIPGTLRVYKWPEYLDEIRPRIPKKARSLLGADLAAYPVTPAAEEHAAAHASMAAKAAAATQTRGAAETGGAYKRGKNHPPGAKSTSA